MVPYSAPYPDLLTSKKRSRFARDLDATSCETWKCLCKRLCAPSFDASFSPSSCRMLFNQRRKNSNLLQHQIKMTQTRLQRCVSPPLSDLIYAPTCACRWTPTVPSVDIEEHTLGRLNCVQQMKVRRSSMSAWNARTGALIISMYLVTYFSFQY